MIEDFSVGPLMPVPHYQVDLKYKFFQVVRISWALLRDQAIAAVEHRDKPYGQEAREWIGALNGFGNSSWLFSFEGVCNTVDLDPADLRTKLLAAPAGTFEDRGGRRGRRSRIGGGHAWAE